jgi:hypothetical protein
MLGVVRPLEVYAGPSILNLDVLYFVGIIIIIIIIIIITTINTSVE